MNPRTGIRSQLPPILILGFACVLAWCIYQPGLSGYFMMDDEPSLSAMQTGGGVTSFEHARQFIAGNDSGALGRPVAMASFLLDDQYWPAMPYSFKRTNLLLHLVTGLLLYWFIRLLLSHSNHQHATLLASITALVWLVHPMNVSTVLYVVQRMTILMSLFSLASLVFYIYARTSIDELPWKGHACLLVCGFCLLLAIFSKENGILTLVYIAVIELTVFSNLHRSKYVKILLLLFVALPLVMLAVYFAVSWGNYLAGYQFRDFSMQERLLTEPRILLQYLFYILLPQPAIGSLVHDGYEISTSLLSPVTTIVALLVNLGLLIIALFLRSKYPLLAFSVLWFFGGHLLESTFIGLELYFEHRNYLPMLGPLLAMIYGALRLAQTSKRSIKMAIVSGAILLLAWASMVTFQTSSMWGEPSVLYRVWAKEHPESPRAQRILGQLLGAEGNAEQAVSQLLATHQRFPYDIGVLIEAKRIACDNNLPQPISVKELETKALNARYVDGLTYYVENLSQTVKDETCQDIGDKEFLQIIRLVKDLPRVNGETKAKLLLSAADVHIRNRNLNSAMVTLDEAFEKHKNPAILMLQSKLLFSAGLVEDAENFLAKAEKLALRNEAQYSLILKNIRFHKKLREQTFQGPQR